MGKKSELYGYTRELKPNTKKTYLTNKLKNQISKTGYFGEVGTPLYKRRIKSYFNLGTINMESINAEMNDKLRVDIMMKYVEREEKIRSGAFLTERVNDAKDNLVFLLSKYTTDDRTGNNYDSDIAKSIIKIVENLGDKEFVVLSELWRVVSEYYESIKENYTGRNKTDLTTNVDNTLSRMIDVLENFGY